MFNANYGMYSGYEVEGNKEVKTEMSNEMGNYNHNVMPGIVCPPIYECPRERQIHREIIHEVPQV